MSTGPGRLWPDVSKIIAIAAPLYVSMLVISLSALVNTAALGQFGTATLAAFAVTVAVYFPAMAAVSGAVRGVMPFVTAERDDPEALRRVVRDGTWLALGVGVLGAAAVAGVPLLARLTGVPEATTSELGWFPLLMSAGVLLNSMGSMATSALVALQRSRLVMYAGLLGAICTATLSPVLVNVVGMGLLGAGTALLVSNLAIAVVTLIALHRHLGTTPRALLAGRVSLAHLVHLARVGIPMAGTVLVKFGVLGVLAFAAALAGTTDAAVHSIATSLVGTTFTAAVAIGQATIPLVSAAVREGDLAAVWRTVTAALVTATGTLGLICAGLLIFRSPVISWFTADPVVAAGILSLLLLVVAAIIVDGAQAVLGFGLTGLKRSAPSFVVFTLCYGVLAAVAVPVVEGAGLVGLWAALAVANLLVTCGQALAFRRESIRVLRPGV